MKMMRRFLMSYDLKYVNKEISRMEESIKIAKSVLKENPNDNWVRKGVPILESYLLELNATKLKLTVER